MIVLVANMYLLIYFGHGPQWFMYQDYRDTVPNADPSYTCKQYWWANLLYINNLWKDAEAVSQLRKL